MTADEVLEAYPDLELGDVQEALHYAAEAVSERELPPEWTEQANLQARRAPV